MARRKRRLSALTPSPCGGAKQHTVALGETTMNVIALISQARPLWPRGGSLFSEGESGGRGPALKGRPVMLSADLPVVGAGVVADAGVGVVGAVGGPAGGGVVEGDVVEVGLSVEPVSPLSLG